MIIHTTHVLPPIPVRNFDWSATLDGYEAGDVIGYSDTEAGAVQDLLNLLGDTIFEKLQEMLPPGGNQGHKIKITVDKTTIDLVQ